MLVSYSYHFLEKASEICWCLVMVADSLCYCSCCCCFNFICNFPFFLRFNFCSAWFQRIFKYFTLGANEFNQSIKYVHWHQSNHSNDIRAYRKKKIKSFNKYDSMVFERNIQHGNRFGFLYIFLLLFIFLVLYRFDRKFCHCLATLWRKKSFQ